MASEEINCLEDSLDGNTSIYIQLLGIERKGGNDDEFAKMIRFSFNISKFVPE